MKERLDILLINKGLVTGRDRAKAVIMSGAVYVDGEQATKAGMTYPLDAEIVVKDTGMKYVSRGGYKLEKALQVFPIELGGKVCLDVGASTGGFTDCMLQNGALRVYAIDVGYGQLDLKLRNDPRVVNMERTNIRYVEKLPEMADFFSVDVAFISLKLVVPVLKKLVQEGAFGVLLIKPQFEAGPKFVGKGGVVRDSKVHIEVIRSILELIQNEGFTALGLDYSPIKGPKGNIEYLLYVKKEPIGFEIDAEKAVNEAHKALC